MKSLIRSVISVIGGCFLLTILIVFALRTQEVYHLIIQQEAYHKGYVDGGQAGYELGLRECNPGVYSPQAEDERIAYLAPGH